MVSSKTIIFLQFLSTLFVLGIVISHAGAAAAAIPAPLGTVEQWRRAPVDELDSSSNTEFTNSNNPYVVVGLPPTGVSEGLGRKLEEAVEDKKKNG